MTEETKQDRRGGKRAGAGRPAREPGSRLFTFRAGGEMAECLTAQPDRTAFIRECIAQSLVRMQPHRLPPLGMAHPADRMHDVHLPYFDLGVVAGFPIPLDNDALAQDIELLRMLCPYPESSYLIRVEGTSMQDAGIQSGDIVIVDKSNRHPAPHEVAVCELNGEYTLKRFVRRGDRAWLVPANPDFEPIEIKPGDRFSVWGTVTYIIHKPHI